MKVDTFACDICGVQKKDTNHWFLGSTAKIRPHEYATVEAAGVSVIPWDAAFLGSDLVLHLCGVSCATKFVARELAK